MTSMFLHKKRVKSEAPAGRPSGKFPIVPFTHEHAAVLSKINSPWFAPLDPVNAGIPGDEVLRNALRSATAAQVAEYVFVVSRPAAQSMALLVRGHSRFTQAAMDYTVKFICPADLEKIVANNASLVVGTIRTPAESPSNPY